MTPVVNFPVSLYLSDYAEVSSPGLQADVLFTDFNEPEWDFRLRVQISSLDADIEIITRPGFRPIQPITAIPGELMRIDQSLLAEYFNLSNLEIHGTGAQFFRSKGRLPEGNYRFCLELLDYHTGEVLSRESCAAAWLQLANPPQIVTPICGEYVNPSDGFINFSWQLFSSSSQNILHGLEYQLRVWELLDHSSDPMTAVPNGRALLVYESDPIMESLFTYGPQELPLEDGKTYIYQVQAIDLDGRDSFKNEGKSEFCYFYYGWPTGGFVDLLEPLDEKVLKKNAIPKLRWSAPDNLISGQQVYYQIEVLEHIDRKSRLSSFHQGRYVHYRETPPVFHRQPGLDTFSTIKPMQEYIWQISAFTGSQQVAESPIGMFYGPVLMDHFYAGNHKVKVESLDSPDLRDASGVGSVRLDGPDGKWVDVNFSGLRLEKNGAYYYLREGEIIVNKKAAIPLAALDTINHDADFLVSGYKLDKNGLSVRGLFRWQLPHPVDHASVSYVKAKEQWLDYNSYKVFGAVRLGHDRNEYKLLDPIGMTLRIDTTSYAYISKDRFRFNLNGTISFLNELHREREKVQLPFSAAEDLYSVSYESRTGFPEEVSLNQQANLHFVPLKYIIDLSWDRSFSHHSDDSEWKGVVFQSFILGFDKVPDSRIQFSLSEALRYDLDNSDSLFLDWTAKGFSANVTITDKVFRSSIHTFEASLDFIQIEILQNEYQPESHIAGDFLIPFFSEASTFEYSITVNNAGLQNPQLSGIQQRTFIHNEGGGDQEVSLYVHQAYFTGVDRINFVIDLHWPAVNARLKRIRGFSCYGDYSIGFRTKNGTVPLPVQLPVNVKGYPANLVTVGAGSNEGYYALALQSEITLTEDVSGGSGAPVVNFYSLAANSYVGLDATGEIREIDQQTNIQNLIAAYEQEYREVRDALQARIEEESADFTAGANVALSQYINTDEPAQLQGDQVDPLSAEERTARVAGRFNDRQAKVVRKISSDMVGIVLQSLTRPVDEKLDTVNIYLENQTRKAVAKADSMIEKATRDIVTKLEDQLAARLANDRVDLSNAISKLAESTQRALADELSDALELAVARNVLEPVTYLIQHDIKFQIKNHIIYHSSEGIYYQLDNQKGLSRQHFDSLYQGLPAVVEDAAGSVIDFVSPDNIEDMIVGLAKDLITAINVQRVAARMKNSALQILKEEINGAISESVAKGLSEYSENIGIAQSTGLPIDFVGIGSRLATGDMKQLAFDPVHIRLKTAMVELDGYIQYRADDPTYGNVWMGDIDMKVSVPKPFALNAIYVNGRKENLPYWFVQISPPREGSTEPVAIGDPIPKGARPLPAPADMGIVKLVAAAGRLYHHMSEQPSGQILPDESMKYGAFMNLVFFDKSRDGELLRMEVLGEINTRDNGDYTVSFEGNLQMENRDVSVLEPSSRSDINGRVSIFYNSAERHFLGYAKVILNKPNTICAEGSLLVDLKPGKWRVALGSREERLVFVPGCVGWSPTGWLDLNQDEAELGVGLQWSIQHLLPSAKGFPVAAWMVRFNIDAGLAFGVMAAVQYNPLQLERAGIWADLWAHIVMDYRLIVRDRWKSLTLVDILLQGDLTLHFAPKPTTLTGNLHGYVSVLFFNQEINAELEKVI